MIPPDEFFLAALQPADIDGQPNPREKEMVLTALRFYFGPAQGWGGVRNVSEPTSLNELNEILRRPGERYELLEQKTSLPAGYFAADQPATSTVKLYAAKRDNPGHPPSFFLYEARHNLTVYIGPDFHHGQAERLVTNTLVLDTQHRPVESLTLHFGDK
jgi:hypothetical protein